MEPAQGKSDGGTSSALRRWGPVGALVVIALVVVGVIVFASGGGDDDTAASDDAADDAASGGAAADGAADDDGDDGAADGDGDDGAADDDGAGDATDEAAADGDEPVDTGLPEGVLSYEAAEEAGIEADFGDRCDPETGRVKIPYFFAPPCWLPFEGENGGATAPGVTEDTIKVVWWQPQEDDIVLNYITDAINNDDTNAQVEETLRNLSAYYETYYETYGRSVELVFFEGSGVINDEVSARADAVKIAEEIEPFMVWSGPSLTNAFAEELAARDIPCIGCGPGQQYPFYADNAPLMWSVGQGPQQTNLLTADLVASQLAGRPAEHAGDEAVQDTERVFGRLWIESSRASVDLNAEFEEALAERGVELAESVSYALDPATIQETAATLIAKLKEAGVTTVLFSGDPVAHHHDFTREATAQGYFPEWVLGGSVLVDTNVFARTYDQEQWQNAFGVTTLSARLEREDSGPYFLHEWFWGEPPPADDSIGVLDPIPATFYAVISGVGPDLTMDNFEQALFTADPTARAITAPTLSYGEKQRWPEGLEPDYLGVDDHSLVWWDAELPGLDELGREAPGMWQFVDGGKRYLLGELGDTTVVFFDPSTSVAMYDEPPPDEARIPYDPLPPAG